MLAVQIEDLVGGLEVVVFPKTYERTRDVWETDAIVVVEGKVDAKDERKKLLCEKAERFTVPEGEPPPPEEPAMVGVVYGAPDEPPPFDDGEAGPEEPDFDVWDELSGASGGVGDGESGKVVGAGGPAGPPPAGQGIVPRDELPYRASGRADTAVRPYNTTDSGDGGMQDSGLRTQDSTQSPVLSPISRTQSLSPRTPHR